MKRIFYLLFAFIAFLFCGCDKEGDLLEKPTFSNLKIKIIGSQSYVVFIDDVLKDSISRDQQFDQFVQSTGELQRLTLKEVLTENVVVDTLIELPHAPAPNFVVLEIDPQSAPSFLSAASLETTAPTSDSLKVNFFNADTTRTKGKVIDISIYQYIGGRYNLINEVLDVASREFTAYTQLPANLPTAYFMEIKDSATGEILVTKESRTARLSRPSTYRTNNVFSLLLSSSNGSTYSTSVILEQKL